MQTFIGLIRGINVGTKNSLPMAELKAMCERLNFKNVRTYIQSGNVLFETALTESAARKELESVISQKMGRAIYVSVRTPEEIAEILANNPFPKADPKQLGIMFLPTSVQPNFMESFSTTTGEKVEVHGREVYIHYVNGMGQSKLKLPKQAQEGTVRNLNTVQKLLELSKCDD